MAGKTPEFVIPAERLKRISDYIEQRGNAKISDLAQELGVSESTVRRDLDTLVREGLIQRSHGGATWIRHSSSYEHVYSEKMLIRGDEKKRIGAFCAEMVRDGDTLFLDSGTTTFQIAAGLRRKKDLTIFTYDLAIASTVEFAPSTTLVVTGGIKRENYNVLIGSVTEYFISRVRFSTLFLSADAIDEEFGVSNTGLPEASIKSKLIASAGRVVLAADSTKFGKVAMVKVSDLSAVQCIVTDRGLPVPAQKRMAELVPEFYAV